MDRAGRLVVVAIMCGLFGAVAACTPNKTVASGGRSFSASTVPGAARVTSPGSAEPVTSSIATVTSPAPARPTSSAPSAVSYIRYGNPRYGFFADVPATFVAGRPPDNGDGQAFTSVDGRATITVSGINNVLDDNPVLVEANLVSDLQSMNGTVTYKNIAGSVVVISGTYPDHNGTTVLYARTVVGAGSEDTLWWTYPVADKGVYDPQVVHTASTFRPGDVSVAHGG
jgi:hypothetical protein